MPVKIFYLLAAGIILLPLHGTSQYIPPVVVKPVPVYTPKDYKGYTPPPKEIKYNPPPAIRETKPVNNTPAYNTPANTFPINKEKVIPYSAENNLNNYQKNSVLYKKEIFLFTLGEYQFYKDGYKLHIPAQDSFFVAEYSGSSVLRPTWTIWLMDKKKYPNLNACIQFYNPGLSEMNYLFEHPDPDKNMPSYSYYDNIDKDLKLLQDVLLFNLGKSKSILTYPANSILYKKDLFIFENQERKDGYKLNILAKDSVFVALDLGNTGKPNWHIYLMDKKKFPKGDACKVFSDLDIGLFDMISSLQLSYQNKIDSDLKLLENILFDHLRKPKDKVVKLISPVTKKLEGYYSSIGSLYKIEAILIGDFTTPYYQEAYKLNIPAKDSFYSATYSYFLDVRGARVAWNIYLLDKKSFPNSNEYKNIHFPTVPGLSFKNDIDIDIRSIENALLLNLGKTKGKIVQSNSQTKATVNGNNPATTKNLANSAKITDGFGVNKSLNGDSYVGDLVNGKKEGLGSLTDVYGNIYRSKFRDNKMEGAGFYLVKATGDKYVGYFSNGQYNGDGVNFIYGSKFYGHFVNGNFTGKGINIPTSGEIYIGNWNSWMKNGNGITLYKNGDMYVGNFSNGALEGKASLYYDKGIKFTCDYVKGFQNGYGTFYYPDGQTVTKYYINGIESDAPVSAPAYIAPAGNYFQKTYPNSEIYFGEMTNGLRSGIGKLTFANGDVYYGNFINDQFEGDGIQKFKDGRISACGFSKNKFQGVGVTVIPGVGVYYGSFVNGKREGDGIYLSDKEGFNYIGQFNNGLTIASGNKFENNGDFYLGNFLRFKFDGLGTSFNESLSEKYVGYFKNSLRNGSGTLYLKDGSSKAVNYVNGVLQ